jgi:hypothetical protein
MRRELTTLFEAVRRSQVRLVAFAESDEEGAKLPRMVLGELCDILGDTATSVM